VYNSFKFFFRSVLLFALSAISLVSRHWIFFWILILSHLVSFTYAASPQHPFPNIPFRLFSDTVQSNFGTDVSLATVLTILFTLVENPDLLNLHFRQQNPKYSGENKVQVSGWIIALVSSLLTQIGDIREETLFSERELATELDKKGRINLLSGKLDKMAICLKLSPYDGRGNYKGKLLPISRHEIEPAYVICPTSFICGTLDCQPRCLIQSTMKRDIPMVALIKGHTVHQNVPVLTGKCRRCNTLYAADHERFQDTSTIQNSQKRVYLNSAKYLKIGQSLWVDRLFSTSAINAMYNFHASASAYAEYWNNTFGTEQFSVTRRQIWQAFVQQSVRTIAEECGIDAEFDDGLNIREVTTQAFSLLGENGIIRAADQHACDECTQKYKKTSDVVFDDPAAVVGMDATDDNIPAMASNNEEVQVDVPQISVTSDEEMDIDAIRYIKMAVMDGVVMGPQVNNI
jgi:CxC5 like cysteine cluster associated with KDZ transposases